MAVHPFEAIPFTANQSMGQSPEQVDEHIREFKSGDSITTYLVVEGTIEFCKRFYEGITEPDVVIFVNPDGEGLESLGINVVDKDWKVGDPKIDVDGLVQGS